MSRRLGLACAVASLIVGGWLGGEQLWLTAKGWLAERWIGDAWRSTLVDGRRHRPWSWADTHPIAQLDVARLGVSRIVLEGAGGGSLAFGPGHVHGTARPNEPGNSVIAGHRDSSFAFLSGLRVGDRLTLRSVDRTRDYAVRAAFAVDRTDLRWLDQTPGDRLTLITCYPFGKLSGGTERFVVLLEPDPGITGLRDEAYPDVSPRCSPEPSTPRAARA